MIESSAVEGYRRLAARIEELERERDETKKRNADLAIQLREERLRKSAPSSALLPKLDAAKSRIATLEAALRASSGFVLFCEARNPGTATEAIKLINVALTQQET